MTKSKAELVSSYLFCIFFIAMTYTFYASFDDTVLNMYDGIHGIISLYWISKILFGIIVLMVFGTVLIIFENVTLFGYLCYAVFLVVISYHQHYVKIIDLSSVENVKDIDVLIQEHNLGFRLIHTYDKSGLFVHYIKDDANMQLLANKDVLIGSQLISVIELGTGKENKKYYNVTGLEFVEAKSFFKRIKVPLIIRFRPVCMIFCEFMI